MCVCVCVWGGCIEGFGIGSELDHDTSCFLQNLLEIAIE